MDNIEKPRETLLDALEKGEALSPWELLTYCTNAHHDNYAIEEPSSKIDEETLAFQIAVFGFNLHHHDESARLTWQMLAGMGNENAWALSVLASAERFLEARVTELNGFNAIYGDRWKKHLQTLNETLEEIRGCIPREQYIQLQMMVLDQLEARTQGKFGMIA